MDTFRNFMIDVIKYTYGNAIETFLTDEIITEESNVSNNLHTYSTALKETPEDSYEKFKIHMTDSVLVNKLFTKSSNLLNKDKHVPPYLYHKYIILAVNRKLWHNEEIMTDLNVAKNNKHKITYLINEGIEQGLKNLVVFEVLLKDVDDTQVKIIYDDKEILVSKKKIAKLLDEDNDDSDDEDEDKDDDKDDSTEKKIDEDIEKDLEDEDEDEDEDPLSQRNT